MLVVVYERGLHLSHVLPFFLFCGLLASSSSERRVGFHATAFSSRPHLSFLFGLAHCAPYFWSHFGSADGATVAHLPDVPVYTAGTVGPIFFGWLAVAPPSFLLLLLSDSCSPL